MSVFDLAMKVVSSWRFRIRSASLRIEYYNASSILKTSLAMSPGHQQGKKTILPDVVAVLYVK